ncbi:MAG: BA14K family protein [Neomegalonema sp.]|nr:BA14K family protein [Neomegalonema sp.]
MKAVKILALILLLGGMGVLVEAQKASAQSRVECVAAAYSTRGVYVRGTRSRARDYTRYGACRAAVSRCMYRMRRARYRYYYRSRYASCSVIRSYVVRARPRYYRRRSYGYCNYRACSRRYRSFRASDCSFQPYRGPRRRCGL